MAKLDLLFKAFPKAVDCAGGHIGEPKLTWAWEQEDDRGYLLVVNRCSHCNIPLSEDYATDEQQRKYEEGLEP